MKAVPLLAFAFFGIWSSLSRPLPTSAAILTLKATPQIPSVSLDAATSARSRADQGDVITVYPDDWTTTDRRFGSKECWRKPPITGGRLVCLEILDLRQVEVTYLTASLPEKRFRRYRFNWSLLPAWVRSELETFGHASAYWSDLRPSLMDMKIEVAP